MDFESHIIITNVLYLRYALLVENFVIAFKAFNFKHILELYFKEKEGKRNFIN